MGPFTLHRCARNAEVASCDTSPIVRSVVSTAPLLLLCSASAFAQTTADSRAQSGAPVFHAVRVQEQPVLDGDVLGDPVWRQAEPVSTFWQERPDEGQPASERTEVRSVYTADTLYLGVVCYDRDPKSIVVSDARRDASLDETDSFQVIFDTFRDRLNGFVFGTNPAGIEYDGQVTNEGQGGGGL